MDYLVDDKGFTFYDCIEEGYRVVPVARTKDCHNPLSGHSWTENLPVKSWQVINRITGFVAGKRNTIEAADKFCEKLCKQVEGRVFWMPRSPREAKCMNQFNTGLK